MNDRKCVKDTQNLGRTCRRGVRTISSMENAGDLVTLTVNPPVVDLLDTKGNPLALQCQKSPEDSPASTSSIETSIQLCPVTGKPIPSLSEIEKTIEKNLILSNWRWPRSIAVKGIALVLRRWAVEEGLERAAEKGELLLSGNPMKYADLANLPWVRLEDIPQLTPEEFAERIGGTVDDSCRGREDNDKRDQRILSSAGAASEGSGAGGKPDTDGVSSRHHDGCDGKPETGGRVLEFRKRRSENATQDGLSRSLVILELNEHQLDLVAFQEAYSCVHRRVQEVKDNGRLMKLVGWSGTSAVMGSMEMAIHSIERVVDELKSILQRIDDGVIPNLDED